ncbi:PRD domain-containing protein [Sutcliffiella rhizosphaerae]|uniref:Levansucrase and sucrase synthesis operon antiterminator n=1 Tax=Sutcliffiella rhizosphaerae TaxID=2880967 RepID=A0ABM8YJC5_9BACI|nr:PRD domain-containing protein [Sutcliffiella rhizosphaerae]CAG9620039.1 Levansucrase and sucrase synthesis operon antiterminator [Sutcliffiella rhizosphaerae]
MKISKLLNNNAVVVKEDDQEKIVMGLGVGFQKKKNDMVDSNKIEKVFVMEEEHDKFQELLSTLPVEHIDVAEEIISYAEGKLPVPLSNHIHISLTDHLSFAIERLEKGYLIHNKLLNEIKALYKPEYEIGVWAKRLIKKKLGVDIPDDEVGHIALHLHTAKMGANSLQNTMQLPTLIREAIKIIEKEFAMEIDESSDNYQLLLAHVRFAIKRAEAKEPFPSMDSEMLTLFQKKFTKSFKTAQTIADFLQAEYHIHFPISEVGYITLHIQRLTENRQ